MKYLKVSRYIVADTIPAIKVYYAILLVVITFFATVSISSEGSLRSSGLEMASVIFLLVAGLNSFKSSFKFTQANNISRTAFSKGLIVGTFPIALLMSVLDLIINRVYNAFVPSPTNFDMIYGSYRDRGMGSAGGEGIVWEQANGALSLLGTVLWQFALYSAIFLLGVLITLVFYRSTKVIKAFIFAFPVILFLVINNTYGLLPVALQNASGQFIAGAFGWQSRNPYMAILSFGILGAVFALCIYLLVRRAEIRE